MEGKIGLWDQNVDSLQDLRPPKTVSTIHFPSENMNEREITIPKIPPEKSSLSVEAKEFVPKPKCHIDTSITEPLLSEQNRQESHICYSNQQNNDYSYSGSSKDDQRLRHLINTLTKDPGQFDNLFDIFFQTFITYIDDVEGLPHVTELIVKQAINHPSFRYTGAKLCCFIEQAQPIFRGQLHITCKAELENNSNKQGILLFVAELYTQLHHENIYGKCLIDAYKKLLQEGGGSNIKCICQALKLTGYSLERYDKKSLEAVLEQLEASRATVTENDTALCLLDSVLSLKNSQWGHGSSNDLCNSDCIDADAYWSDGETNTPNTVFYNMDGNMLSTEETEFLAANLQSTDEYLIDSSDPDELCDPEPEMDEEIQVAFREFVKLSKR